MIQTKQYNRFVKSILISSDFEKTLTTILIAIG